MQTSDILPGDAVPRRNRIRKPSFRMPRREMAVCIAEHYGLYASSGGWLYRKDGTVVCQGYAALAERLGPALIEGRGIDWRRIHGV